MANPLTGDFEAVVQVSVPTVNRLLASMHQNDDNDAGLPTLPHRAVVDVPDKPLGGSLAGIKGTAHIQIGVPTVALIAGAPRSANVSCWIRARYNPDANTVSLPEFIHGKIVARFDVTHLKFLASFIRAAVSSNDADITFTDSGLNAAASQKVTGLIRYILRTRGSAVLSLPSDIPSGALDFQALTDSQGRQAVALPITLKGAAAGPGSLGQVFLDGSDFAIAIGKEPILALMQPALKALNEAKPKFSVKVSFGWGWFSVSTTAHYTVSMTAEVGWNNGLLTLSISGAAETPHWLFPNADFTINQSFTFAFDAATQSISITPFGEPEVNVTVGFPYNFVGSVTSHARNAVRDRFEKERDAGLAAANQEISAALPKQCEQVRKLLRKIDDAAEVIIESVPPPTNDGVVLRGKISLSLRKEPHVEFSKLGDGSGYTAFDSWVPGGRIQHFHWTWWHAKDYVPGEPKVPFHETFPTPLVDRFVLREKDLPGIPATGPAGGKAGTYVIDKDVIDHMFQDPETGVWIPPEGQLCLEIGFEHVDPKTGQMVTGEATEKLNPGIACIFPTWTISFYTKPKDYPGPCPEGNVIVTQPVESELVSGSEILLQAIRQAERPDAPITLALALRIGRRGPSPALAARARELRRRFPHLGVVLADRDGHWLQSLDLPSDESRPALRLLDSAGRLAWRYDGVADATTIAAALRQHLLAGLRSTGGLEPRLRPGNRAPDFSFEVAPGHRIALRHLRGRRLAILFVSEGDAALEAVLSQLSARASETSEPRMVIVVQDGEPSGTAAAPRALSFDWVVVPDPEGAIARSYGITMRPTAVLVDWDGRVTTLKAMSPAIATRRPAPAGRVAERG